MPRGIRYYRFLLLEIHIRIKTVRCEPVVNWCIPPTEHLFPLPDQTRSNHPNPPVSTYSMLDARDDWIAHTPRHTCCTRPFYGPLPRYRKCAHRRSRPPRSLEHEACPRARTRFAGSCPSRFARSTHQRRQRRFRQTVCAFERHKSTSPAHTGRISCRTTARSA